MIIFIVFEGISSDTHRGSRRRRWPGWGQVREGKERRGLSPVGGRTNWKTPPCSRVRERKLELLSSDSGVVL